MKVYISGPMRGYPFFNFPAFFAAEERLKAAGWEVINPARLDVEAGFDPRGDENYNTAEKCKELSGREPLLQRDLDIIRAGIDAIYLLEGWGKSQGAQREYHESQRLDPSAWLMFCCDAISTPEYVKAIRCASTIGHAPTLSVSSIAPDSLVPPVLPDAPVAKRVFSTGASRDTDEGKLDYDGFLSPIVLECFAEYMHQNRKMKDGSLRASDNWQKGIPRDQYRKSAWRHFFEWWRAHRNGESTHDAACALLFNVMGDLHEDLLGRDVGEKDAP